MLDKQSSVVVVSFFLSLLWDSVGAFEDGERKRPEYYLLSCNTSTAGETSQRSVNVWEQQCCTAPFPRISMASVRMGGNAFTIPLLSSPPLFQPYMQANQAWLPVWLPPSHCLSFGVANPMGNCFSSSHSSHALIGPPASPCLETFAFYKVLAL